MLNKSDHFHGTFSPRAAPKVGDVYESPSGRAAHAVSDGKATGLRDGKATGLRDGKATGLRDGKATGLRDGFLEIRTQTHDGSGEGRDTKHAGHEAAGAAGFIHYRGMLAKRA